jgi:hypothetical protein
MENLELSAPSILQLFETTKEQRTSFVNDIIEKLNDGVIDPLKVHLQVKSLEDIINQLTNTTEKTNKNFQAAVTYKKILLEAYSNYGAGKEFEFANAKFQQKEVGTKYDYSGCNDAVINDLLVQKAALDAKIKERESFLKTIAAAGLETIVEDEVVTIYPPSKSSTTSIAVTLK